MTIITLPDGKLATIGARYGDEAEARAQQEEITKLRTTTRKYITGEIAFYVDPMAAPAVQDEPTPQDEPAVQVETAAPAGPSPGTERKLRHLVHVRGAYEPAGVVRGYKDPSFAAHARDVWARELGEDYRLCDIDGWIPHDPKPGAVCPVPEGVRCAIKYSDGGIQGMSGGWESCIVAWKPLP